MSWAVTNGIATSMTTSPDTMIGVAIEGALNSRRLFVSVRTTSRPLSPSSLFFLCI